MNKIRRNQGFSVAEMLVVVGILIILFGVSFIAVQRYMRSMAQLERDGYAKEIFVAAQNHLTMADSQGLVSQRDKQGTPETNATENHIFYYIVGAEGSYPNDSGNRVLDLMLPFAAVDETLRSGGSYVIRYQTDPALVLDVFYASKNGRYAHTFTTADYTDSLLKGETYKGEGNTKRRSYGSDNSVIGWYGGDGLSFGDVKELKAPTIKVYNDETLRVEVTDSNAGLNHAKVRLIIKGQTSLAMKSFTADSLLNNKQTFVLDDITQSGKHFADIVADTPEIQFIPGENLEIYAEAYYDDDTLSNVPQSAKQYTNSLFDYNPNDTSTALISNIRHLENLDKQISNLDANDTSKLLDITNAEQTMDLSWSDFMEKTNKENTQIHAKVSNVQSTAGTYMPINPNYNLTYDGGSNGILDLNVSCSGPAGVFGTLGGNQTVQNLAVYNSTAADTYKIVSASTAGGLVGTLSGGTVTNCGAAVWVQGSTAAGGLIGSMTSGTVSASYSGGHTTKGEYDESKINVTASNGTAGGFVGTMSGGSISNSYSTCSASGNTAGGFAGSATTGSNITSAYSTGLVQGTGESSTAAAFVGSGSPTLSDCQYLSIINPGMALVGTGTSYTGLKAADADLTSFNRFMTLDEKNKAKPYDTQLQTYYKGQYAYMRYDGMGPIHYGDWPSPETLVINTKSGS